MKHLEVYWTSPKQRPSRVHYSEDGRRTYCGRKVPRPSQVVAHYTKKEPGVRTMCPRCARIADTRDRKDALRQRMRDAGVLPAEEPQAEEKKERRRGDVVPLSREEAEKKRDGIRRLNRHLSVKLLGVDPYENEGGDR